MDGKIKIGNPQYYLISIREDADFYLF